MHAAIGKRFVKFDHQWLVLRPDRTNRHFNAADLRLSSRNRSDMAGLSILAARHRACCGSCKTIAGIERDDLFRRDQKRD